MSTNTNAPQVNRGSKPIGVIFLLTTAIVWGGTFVANTIGGQKVETFTFIGIRTIIGALCLTPIVFYVIKKHGYSKKQVKKTILHGIIIGIFLCAATNLQQFALGYTASGKVAFITALYMVIVPVLGILFFKKKIRLLTWCCVAGGFVGMFLLCVSPGASMGLGLGELTAFLCAVLFAVHIMVIELFASEDDGIILSCVQFYTAGILSLIGMVIFDTPSITAITESAIPLLYSGIMCCGVGFTFQIVGQKYTEATVASLLLSMESVFAVIFAGLFLGEQMSTRETIGCFVMFTAIIFSQLSVRSVNGDGSH